MLNSYIPQFKQGVSLSLVDNIASKDAVVQFANPLRGIGEGVAYQETSQDKNE